MTHILPRKDTNNVTHILPRKDTNNVTHILPRKDTLREIIIIVNTVLISGIISLSTFKFGR